MEKNFQSKKNFLEKKEFLKSLIFGATGIDDEVKIVKMLRHLWDKNKLGYNKFGERKLTNEELILLQVLNEQELAPTTVYRWFNLCRASKDALDLVKNNKLSQNELVKARVGVKSRWVDPEKEKLGKEILKDIIKIVEAM